MSYVKPTTRSAGYVVGATQWNELVSNDRWLGGADADGRPFCWSYRSTALSVADFTSTPLTWNANFADNAGIHSTSVNPSRFTAPVDGWYRFVCNAFWAADADGVRSLDAIDNGTGNVNSSDVRGAFGIFDVRQQVQAILRFSAGMYVEAVGVHTAGNAIDLRINSWASLEWISALN